MECANHCGHGDIACQARIWLFRNYSFHCLYGDRLFDACDKFFAPLNSDAHQDRKYKSLSSDDLDPLQSTTFDETGIGLGLLEAAHSKASSSLSGAGLESANYR